MICTFTARRLRANAYDAFRAAWDPRASGDELRGWTHIYHARDVADPDVVISFGLFDGSLDELHFVVLFGRGRRLSGALGFSRPRALMAYRPFIERAASFEEALKFKQS